MPELDALLADKPATHDDVATSSDDVALLAFTSGTTGRPKATMHFHRDVLAICDTFSRHVLRPDPDDVFTGTPPYAFTFGLGGVLLFPLHAGASTVLVEKATPVELAAIIDEFGVTTCFTAPTAYKAMLAAGATLPSLQAAVSAGEHLPAATWQAFRDATGVRIIDGIGATEMLHIFISAAGDDIVPGSTGRAVPGYTATVLDADGAEAPPGEPGRLAVKGPTGCRYLDDPRQRGYVARRLEHHRRHVHPRRGRLLLLPGPQRRHDHLLGLQHRRARGGGGAAQAPGGRRVRGGRGAGRGARVAGQGVRRARRHRSLDGPEKARELQDFVKAEIAPYKYPRAVEFVDALPRTATGKLQRFRLRQDA